MICTSKEQETCQVEKRGCDGCYYNKLYLFRFMSNDEFNKYRSGKVMRNRKDHKKSGQKTTSKGFCFLNINEYDPEYALHFLSGIVDFSICAVFEVKPDNVFKTWGRYAEPIQSTDNPLENIINLYNLWNKSFIANEYCTKEYSRKTFKLIKYTIPDWYNWEKWNWEDCNNEIQTTKRIKKTHGKRNKTVRT